MHPCVSVIIPVYNAEPYLRRCLDSVLTQTLRDIEIICVNDASTDASSAILHEYASQDPRIKVVELEQNVGESRARNIGIHMACGEYVGSVDNDDMVDSSFFERLYTLASTSHADIVKGDCIEINTQTGNTTHRYINADVRKNKMCFCYQWWTAIYRRELLLQHDIWFPEELCLGGDIVFLVKALINANTVGTLDDIYYYYYRRSDSGDSQLLPTRKIDSLISAYEQVFTLLNENYPARLSDEQYEFFYNWYFTSLFQSIPERCEDAADREKCASGAERLRALCKRPEALPQKVVPPSLRKKRNLLTEIRKAVKTRLSP